MTKPKRRAKLMPEVQAPVLMEIYIPGGLLRMQHNLKETSRAWEGRSSLGNVGCISVCPAPSPVAS